MTDEKRLQQEISEVFLRAGMEVLREFSLDAKNRVDFFVNGIAIEIKVKGTAAATLAQIERYSKFESVKELLLVTTKSHPVPARVNGKPLFVVRLGYSWL